MKTRTSLIDIFVSIEDGLLQIKAYTHGVEPLKFSKHYSCGEIPEDVSQVIANEKQQQ